MFPWFCDHLSPFLCYRPVPCWDFSCYFFLPATFWDKGSTICCRSHLFFLLWAKTIHYSLEFLTNPSSYVCICSSDYAAGRLLCFFFIFFLILCLKYGNLFLSIARLSIAHLPPWILFSRRGKAHVFTLHFSPHASFLTHLYLQWVTGCDRYTTVKLLT